MRETGPELRLDALERELRADDERHVRAALTALVAVGPKCVACLVAYAGAGAALGASARLPGTVRCGGCYVEDPACMVRGARGRDCTCGGPVGDDQAARSRGCTWPRDKRFLPESVKRQGA